MAQASLTAQRLRQVVDYDPATGAFTWRERASARPSWNSRFAGKPAGYIDTHGYRKVMIDERNYYAHRLAWLFVHGEWPAKKIDHRFGDRDSAQLGRLREASARQNVWNSKRRIDNASGFKGVCWEKFTGKWKAEIRAGARRLNLGRFDTAEEAHRAYSTAAIRLHGEFARTV